jgi:hypothetical protein
MTPGQPPVARSCVPTTRSRRSASRDGVPDGAVYSTTRQIALPGDGPTGVFLSEDGGTCPW